MTDLAEHHRLVAERLDRRGIRYTSARRAVVAALSSADGPVTPAGLQERVDLPLSSLYRSLGVLADAGVVSRTHDANGVALVELDEWLAGHHHHLVCTACGEVRDLDMSPDDERRIGGFIEQLGVRAGYRVTGHRIDIEGTCASCR